VHAQLHPQLGGLVHHDEPHLVVLAGQRRLRPEYLVELQVFAIARRFAEVPVNALARELDAGPQRRLA